MRKFLIITTMCVLLFALCSCSEPVGTPQYVDNMIAEADRYELDEAREAYYALTKEERAEVKNVEQLCLKIHENNCSEIYDEFKESAKRILEDSLLNPASLQIHSLRVRDTYYCDAGFVGIIEIDYSAQNGFGGYVRNKNTMTLYIDTEEDDKGEEFFCSGKHEDVPKVCGSLYATIYDYGFDSKRQKEIESPPKAHE